MGEEEAIMHLVEMNEIHIEQTYCLKGDVCVIKTVILDNLFIGYDSDSNNLH